MGQRVGMIHGISSNVRLFNHLTSEIMPDIDVIHFVDEGLLSLSGERSRERIVRRLKLLASFAEESEAEAVMLTCTAFGRLVDEVKDAINELKKGRVEFRGDKTGAIHLPIGKVSMDRR